MGKNFGSQHAIVAFFTSYTILLYNSRKIVVFTPVRYRYRYPTVALRITPTLSTTDVVKEIGIRQ